MTITKKEVTAIAKLLGVPSTDVAIAIAGALSNAPRTKFGKFQKNIMHDIIEELFQKPLLCA